MRKSLRWKRGKEDKKERRLRGGGLGGRLKMMLRLVGDGQHKLMRKRLRKVAMQVGMKVMELKKGWRKEVTTVLLNSGWLILLTTHRDIIIYLVVCVSQHPSGCPEYCPRILHYTAFRWSCKPWEGEYNTYWPAGGGRGQNPSRTGLAQGLDLCLKYGPRELRSECYTSLGRLYVPREVDLADKTRVAALPSSCSPVPAGRILSTGRALGRDLCD